MARYVEKAVDALQSQINTQIAAKLSAVEADSSIVDGTIPRPVAVIKHIARMDNRSPMIQVWEEGFAPDDDGGGQRNGVYRVPCRVVLALRSDADLSTAEITVRRYVDAILRSVFHDETLGGNAVQAIFTGGQAHTDFGDDASTRHIYELAFEVTVKNASGG